MILIMIIMIVVTIDLSLKHTIRFQLVNY